MKAKLIIDNKELEVEITEEELEKIRVKPKTGYEKDKGDRMWYVSGYGDIEHFLIGAAVDTTTKYYNNANYYSSKTVAENNARADKLMRQLRRFVVEHRENSTITEYCEIYYNDIDNKCRITAWTAPSRYLGSVVFSSKEAAQLAIDTFHDELIWYFTEYKDSL